MIGKQSDAAAFGDSMTESCWLCGIRLRVDQLVPDGGRACSDVRWYCRDMTGCTQRWTARLKEVPVIPETIPGSAGTPRRIAG